MYLFIKRVLDIIIAIFTLIVLFPLLLTVIFVLMFTGEKEVLYKQLRIGYKQREFMIWKFATMLKNSPSLGSRDITLRNDPRVTKVGRYLRITKINELPQLINVLIGDMSIVGPRPLMPVSFDYYLPEHKEKVYNSKPGITGISQLLLRDEEKIVSEANRNGADAREFYINKIYPFKGKVEMWYQKNKSLWIDTMICLLTVWIVFFPGSDLSNKVFKGLPEKPEYLEYKQK